MRTETKSAECHSCIYRIDLSNQHSITATPSFVVQLLNHVWFFVTPWTVGCQASRSITNSRRLLKLMSIESVMPSNHFILCHPLLLLPSIFPSIRVFSNKSAILIRWPKYWSFSFRTSPSNEYSGLISFRIYFFDFLEVQGTLKSLFQHHNLEASILWLSDFFMFQLSQPNMTTGKTIALTIWTFVSKVTSLLFNRVAIAILPIYVCLYICRHVDGCVSVYVHVYICMCICSHTHIQSQSECGMELCLVG